MKRLFITTTILLLLAISSFAQVKNLKKYNNYMQRGNELSDSLKFFEAYEYYDNAEYWAGRNKKRKQDAKDARNKAIANIKNQKATVDSLLIVANNNLNTNSKINEYTWFAHEISPTIAFGRGSSSLFSSCFGELDMYIVKMRDDKNLIIKIEVHTDNIGSKKHKQILSENRAYAIAQYLKAKGVNKNQIYTSGMGDSKPVSSNATAEGRRQNNRTVIFFNKKIRR